jgi:hypothetical protein
MVDNNENILVEFDYNNITIVDPNKVIDSNGVTKERLIKHENLVFYANLECKVIPRTKLAIGVANNDAIQTIAVATINFIKQRDKEFLDNSYTDEITGKDSLTGLGTNQTKQEEIPNQQNPQDSFVRQTLLTGGKFGATDNQMLGITSINVKQGLDFLPVISITLEDIKGRALFEAAENSPYAAFFNLPYPLFYLTLKGYYGKAIRLALMLQSFNSRYDTYTGNFKVDLKFYTYKYTVLGEISMGYLLAVPHMYKSRIQVQPIKGSTNSKFERVDETTVSRGLQKIKELYSEYKSKGLIPDDFPEITLNQMQERLENFIANELDKFTKQNMTPLDDVNTYSDLLKDYAGNVYYYNQTSTLSWFNKYMDTKNFFVTKNGLNVYTFKSNFNGQNREDAKAELIGIINNYNKQLNENKTVGSNGQYTINNKTIKIQNTSNVTYNTFIPENFTINDIDLKATYLKNKNTKQEPTDTELNAYKLELSSNLGLTTSFTFKDGTLGKVNNFFYFTSPNTQQVQGDVNNKPLIGDNSFISIIDSLNKQLIVFTEQIETELTDALSNLITSNSSGIGFVPSIRNVLAVIFANGEAFLRLMDDVHTSAWNINSNNTQLKVRKDAIFNPQVANASQDNMNSGVDENTPIYPWPQMIKQTTGTDGHELYEIVYPGDNSVINQTKAYLPDYWPEVEFVEEFISGFTDKESTLPNLSTTQNEETNPQRISLNAIEFPIGNDVFSNKEEVKFLYEIYERVLFISYYSRLNRSNDITSDSDIISRIISDAELGNIIKSLSNDNPFLIKKLKEYKFSGENFELILRHISNGGVGESWQNFIRGIFNTPYIKNKINNSNFEFITQQVINNSLSQPLVSLPTENEFNNYISDSTTSNDYDFADTYPFTNVSWVKNNLANGVTLTDEKSAFDTRTILTYNQKNKIINNIDSYENGKRPFTHFLWKSPIQPFGYEVNTQSIKDFYINRVENIGTQLVTEGNLKYFNYSGNVSANQTVSMLNTPYFINAIQKGVENFRNYEEYPYVEAAYLFINSLPLATLREKYRTENDSDDLSYIFATLKKFGAIHKIPYAWVLKYGSIWHRYKKYIETNVDILDSIWQPFNYVKNFDPITNDITKTYSFNAGGNVGIVDMVLQKTVNIGNETSDTINTGFYPKTINDFNVFLQGVEIFSGYTSTAIEDAINISGLTLNYVDNAIIVGSEGFDPNSPNRDLRIFPWTIYINSKDNVSSFIIPSQGSIINQTKNECFDNDGGNIKLKIEVLNNQSVFDGSVRTFWVAPNYGYFNGSDVTKPTFSEYLKQIYPDKLQQENFSLNGDSKNYTDISEMFSVFEKNVLDLFEKQFLNFSKSKYDYSYENVTNNDSETSKIFKNFQLTMIELFKIDKITGNDGKTQVEDAHKKQLTKITETIKNFLINETLIVKFGNPSQFDKRLFYTFSNYDIVDPYEWNQYQLTSPNAVPTVGGPLLTLSKSQYPNEWKALETYVGFSEIPELVYDNDGSFITDFFIDMGVEFTVTNIINFAPIIKIYATQKLVDNTLTKTKFTTLMDGYIQSTLDLKNRVLNNLMIKVTNQLPNVGNSVGGRINTKLPDGLQTKVEIWESFKALNDKWISGNDFKTKTLFEDVLLLDRASRNIGEKVIVDIEGLKNRLSNIDVKTPMLYFVNTILVENNFVIMNLPSYVNFYNVQDAIKNPIPRADGTLEFANSLFGTFLNVDYRQSSPKMVCFYGAKSSEHLNLKNNIDYRYRNDAFELTRSSDNPLVEDLIDKKDWDKSNKVVGFSVDIGPQNQSIFYGFQVSQDAGKATIESLSVLNQMANQSGNRGTSTQNVSLYNLYKNRSYSCTLSMMGNAMIQPTMYFNLRHVPMFNGPYMITRVDHTITPGNFETIVEGIRQPVATLPKLDNYLQSLRKNLKTSINRVTSTIKKQREVSQINSNPQSNIINQTSGVNNRLTSKESTTYNNSITETCSDNLLNAYSDFIAINNPGQSIKTMKEMKGIINSVITNNKLRQIVFCAVYLQSGDNEVGFKSVGNNFGGITISKKTQTQRWNTNFNKQYYCSQNNIPHVVFNTPEDSISFLNGRFKDRVEDVQLTKESITKFLIINSDTSVQRKIDVYDKFDPKQKLNIESIVEKALNLYNNTIIQ